MQLPLNEAGLRHYLDTILGADESVFATNNGLKTSNDVAFVLRGRSIKCVLCDLCYVSITIAKRLADDYPCILVPWHFTLRKLRGITWQRSAARRSNGANPEDDTLLWRQDNTADAPSSFLSDLGFQDGDIDHLKEMLLPHSFVLSFFPPRSKLAFAYLTYRFTHMSTVV